MDTIGSGYQMDNKLDMDMDYMDNTLVATLPKQPHYQTPHSGRRIQAHLLDGGSSQPLDMCHHCSETGVHAHASTSHTKATLVDLPLAGVVRWNKLGSWQAASIGSDPQPREHKLHSAPQMPQVGTPCFEFFKRSLTFLIMGDPCQHHASSKASKAASRPPISSSAGQKPPSG